MTEEARAKWANFFEQRLKQVEVTYPMLMLIMTPEHAVGILKSNSLPRYLAL